MPKFPPRKILKILFLSSAILVSVLIVAATDQSDGVFNFEVSATSHCSGICSNNPDCGNACNPGVEHGVSNYQTCTFCSGGTQTCCTQTCSLIENGCSWAGCTNVSSCGVSFGCFNQTCSEPTTPPPGSETPTPTPTPTFSPACSVSPNPVESTALYVYRALPAACPSGSSCAYRFYHVGGGSHCGDESVWDGTDCTGTRPGPAVLTEQRVQARDPGSASPLTVIADVACPDLTVNPPPSNSPPTASSVTVTEPNYCAAGPSATVTWAYSDPEGQPQSAYQTQIDDTGSAWNTPVFDSGKVLSSGTSYFQSGLAFNVTYKARARVWDSLDLVGSWTEMSVCNGPGCLGGGNSWKTPKHAYPAADFTWSPLLSPSANQPIQFTDLTQFFDSGGVGQRAWNWLFNAPSPSPFSTLQNPIHTYASAGSYNVSETVTDKDGYQCARTKPLNIQRPIPIWKEVSPK